MKKLFYRNQSNMNVSWIIIILGICVALAFFLYAIFISSAERVRGDAMEYILIANYFPSIRNAISYIGDRTYGFPLFLYLIKKITSPESALKWIIACSYVQFLLHIVSCLIFYLFFLKKKFGNVGLPSVTADFVTALLITYPTLVTYTTVPLTDTFCTDLFLLAFVLTGAIYRSKVILKSILYSILCGLLLGYIGMVRPSFWPSLIVFYFVLMLMHARLFKKKQNRSMVFKIIIMGICTTLPTLPSVMRFHAEQGKIAIQNREFLKSHTIDSLHVGLAAVRVYWSEKRITSFTQASGIYDPFFIPGIYDPFLREIYWDKCQVNSILAVGRCLLSKPQYLPFYFGKKTIGLFDVPHITPYLVDATPKWFTIFTRLFEVLAFGGFIALLISIFTRPFFRIKPEWIGLPWAIFVIALIGMQTLFHVEGRYGFPVIPLSVASLFLGYAGARSLGNRFCVSWFCIIIISMITFLYQVYAWDLIPPL